MERPDNRRYLAVIGDIRASREHEGRAALQRTLVAGLESVNREFAEALAARFVVTLGDEFQGLLGEAGPAVEVLMALDNVLRGVPLRYALGWGTLSTPLREEAVGIDGPCFHRAREAMVLAKKEDRDIVVSGFGRDDGTLNALFSLVGVIRSGWKPVQRETVEAVRRAATSREVAAARGVAESTVSKALRAAHYRPVLAGEQAIADIMRRYGGESTPDHPSGRETR